jgi:endonuclease/exonuclease/phosphatase family metal-dependent hydrolase
LQNTTKSINRKEVLIVMGELNAKVGSSHVGLELIMGKHSLGAMNNNGELFVDFCVSNNLFTGGTIFAHKNCRKASWVSSDHRTQNQIDHLAISRKWRRSLLDVRNKLGADIGSDHHLMMAKVQIKIPAAKKKFESPRKRFDVQKLQN